MDCIDPGVAKESDTTEQLSLSPCNPVALWETLMKTSGICLQDPSAVPQHECMDFICANTFKDNSCKSFLIQRVKDSTCNEGDQGSIPGLGRFPGEGNGNPLQILENPMDKGA